MPQWTSFLSPSRAVATPWESPAGVPITPIVGAARALRFS
jgi:hypothetical protein